MHIEKGEEPNALMEVYQNSLRKQQAMQFVKTVSLPKGQTYQTVSCISEGTMGLIPVRACLTWGGD